MEVWKDIPGYEGRYQVSNLGRVKSLDYMHTGKPKVMKLTVCKTGYLSIELKGKPYRVHRLVASVFVPNPDNKSEVNHINGNIQDNTVGNLEWCTPSENVSHAWKSGLQKMTEERRKKHSRKVVCVETGIEYYGMKDASNKTNIDRRNINACCLGKRSVAGGYHWRYKEVE